MVCGGSEGHYRRGAKGRRKELGTRVREKDVREMIEGKGGKDRDGKVKGRKGRERI